MPDAVCLAIGCFGIGFFVAAVRVWSLARDLARSLEIGSLEAKRDIALVVERKLNRQFRDRFAEMGRQLAEINEDVTVLRGSWPFGIVDDEEGEAGVLDEPTIHKLKEGFYGA